MLWATDFDQYYESRHDELTEQLYAALLRLADSHGIISQDAYQGAYEAILYGFIQGPHELDPDCIESAGIEYNLCLRSLRADGRVENVANGNDAQSTLYLPEYFARSEGAKRREQIAALSYPEYLMTSEWLARRDLVLIRDDRQCVHCGSSEKLHVHHLTYARRGHERLSDLVTLCASCHAAVHQIGLH